MSVTPEERKAFDLFMARIDEKLEDIKENIDILKEELADKTRDISEQVKKVENFQKTILEPNQQLMYKEIQGIAKAIGKPEETE